MRHGRLLRGFEKAERPLGLVELFQTNSASREKS
jgi:hypothetical protein